MDHGFKQGCPITDHQISLIIEKLGRTLDMFSVDRLEPAYRKFLNTYGSIYGKGFVIRGPNRLMIDDEEKIYDLAAIQLGFEDRCKLGKMKEEKAKSCWLIAEMCADKQYYINLSEGNNMNYIYCMHRDGTSEIFATDFLDFLDKFFESHNRKNQEKDYRERNYK